MCVKVPSVIKPHHLEEVTLPRKDLWRMIIIMYHCWIEFSIMLGLLLVKWGRVGCLENFETWIHFIKTHLNG